MDNKTRKPRLAFGVSIRARLIAILVGLTLFSVVAIGALAIFNTLNANVTAQEKSSERLRAQAEDFLVRLTTTTANANDQEMEHVRQQAGNVAQYAANLFDRPQVFTPIFSPEAYWRATNHMHYGPEGQYLSSIHDKTTVFIPNNVEITDELITELELTAYMDFIFEPVFNSIPNATAIYIATPKEINRLYPNIDLGAIVPADYQATQDIFFTAGTPENNPNRKIVFTPVYDDPAGQGLLVSAIAPIYTRDDKFVGIIGIDISLANLTTQLDAARPVYGGYLALIDHQDRAIALPRQGYKDILGREPEPNEFGADLSAARPEFTDALYKLKMGSTGVETVNLGDRELFVAYAPLKGTRWSIATIAPASSVLQTIGALEIELEKSTQSLINERLIPFGAFILGVVILIGLFLANRLVDPIRKLADAAQSIGAGDWDTPLPKTGRDELGVLTGAFASMTAQLRDLVEGLEQRVAERTRQIETSAEVSRRLSTIIEIDQLVKEVVDQLQAAFNYYHAHIYLYDHNQENLVMMGGTGEAGQIMLARGHQIPRGRGLVGRAAEANEAVLVADTTQDPNWLPNPLLPETKSELAVPIAVGDQVLGVLDVQQNVVNGLKQDDVALVEAIAGQVAIAAQNARTYAATRQRAEREALAAEIRNRIQATTTIEDALKIAVREIGRAVGAPKTRVRLGTDN